MHHLLNSTYLTYQSRNKKTGNIAVSTSSESTCPPNCPLINSGCYGKTGPLFWHWKKVSNNERGDNWTQFLEKVKRIPLNELFRHNQVGDLQKSEAGVIDGAKLKQLVVAAKDVRGFTYTHYDVIKNKTNRVAVKAANLMGFTINLSGNNLDHADSLIETKAGPVVSVLPLEYQRKIKAGKFTESLVDYKTRLTQLPDKSPKGHKIVICPATYQESITCKNCGLCQKQRDSIVGFPVHGNGKKKAESLFNKTESRVAA